MSRGAKQCMFFSKTDLWETPLKKDVENRGGRMKIYYKKVRDGAKIPEKATAGAAGYDLYACIPEPVIVGTEPQKIPTGLSLAIPDGYAGFLYARSGLASKFGLRPANCVGVIDSDYRGECIVVLRNDKAPQTYTVNPGDRIAQLIIAPVVSAQFEEEEHLNDTSRGTGGFGSTGIS